MGDDYDQVLTTGMGAEDAPDVMYMWNYPLYYEGLEPLEPYMEAEGEEFKENIYEALWNYNQFDDVIYGMPIGYTTHALFYNEELFDQAGLDYPTSDWTWTDVREAAQEISSLDDHTYGMVFPGQPDPYSFEMYLWSNGAEYIDDEGSMEGHLNSSESVEVFTLFQDMLKEGEAVASEGWGTEEMRSGTVGMHVYGAWNIDSLADSGVQYGVVEAPSFEGKGESVSVVNTSGLAMSKDSEHKDAAWEFIKFWTNEEANKERINYELPVLRSVVESENLEEDELRAPFYAMLDRSEDYTPTSFRVEDWTRISESLELAFEEIFNENVYADPEETLNRMAE